MLGGIPYNSPVVLALINAVYQSNVSGTVLNQPFHGGSCKHGDSTCLHAFHVAVPERDDEFNRIFRNRVE